MPQTVIPSADVVTAVCKIWLGRVPCATGRVLERFAKALMTEVCPETGSNRRTLVVVTINACGATQASSTKPRSSSRLAFESPAKPAIPRPRAGPGGAS